MMSITDHNTIILYFGEKPPATLNQMTNALENAA